jgi:hypothetical protein
MTNSRNVFLIFKELRYRKLPLKKTQIYALDSFFQKAKLKNINADFHS